MDLSACARPARPLRARSDSYRFRQGLNPDHVDNLRRQVLDYFDAFRVDLTATPDARTRGFLHQNVFTEYTHVRPVADGANVQGDIDTDVTRNSGRILQVRRKVRRNFRDWILRKNAGQLLNDERTAFLQLIRDHVITACRHVRGGLAAPPLM